MREKWRISLGASLAVLAIAAYYAPWTSSDKARAESAVQAAALGERVLIPGGQAVGVALKTQGVLVVAKGSGEQVKTPLREGDIILSADGTQVSSAVQLAECITGLERDEVLLHVQRGDREMDLVVSVPVSDDDGKRRLGVWVRDSTAGVGTISYVDPDTRAYGALGHAIVDADTGSTLTVQDGALLRATVVGVTHGQNGKAGELKGNFLKAGDQIGTLEFNGIYGIYGTLDDASMTVLYPDGLPIGARSKVHTGAASIISTVDDGGPQEYAVEILRCNRQEEPGPKGMVLRVTDERLLAKTGGIVQGMSGSPIIQDGHIVGAVTHVYLSDSTQGYGMYIEWMLEQSDRLSAVTDSAA